MVLWLGFYATTIAAAFTHLGASALSSRLSPLELLTAAVAVGTVAGGWLVLLIAMLVGRLSLFTIVLSFVLLLAAMFARYGAYRRAWGALRAKRSLVDGDDAVALILAAAIALPLWSLYSSRMIPEGGGGRMLSGGSCYGDLPIHMQIAESFLVGCNVEMSWGGLRSPIFWPEPLTYPFLPDFHAAVLVRAGATMSEAFRVPGFAMALALCVMLYYFSLRITRSRLGAVIAVALTVFAGGLGGPRWIAAKGWAEASFSDVVQHDHTGEWKHLWFAFIPHILLPQRGGTFAYPIAVLCLLLVWLGTEPEVRHVGTAQEQRMRLGYAERTSLLVHAGAFAGMLPLVQAHAFIGIGIIIATTALMDAHKWLADPRLLPGWAAAGAVTLITAGPQMTLFAHTVTAGAYGHFLTYGWLFMKDLYIDFGTPHNIVGFYRFWWHSLGPVLPLLTIGCALLAVEAAAAWRLSRVLRAAGGPASIEAYSKAFRDVAAVASSAGGLPAATDSDEDDRALPSGEDEAGVRQKIKTGRADAPRKALLAHSTAADRALRPLYQRFEEAAQTVDASVVEPLVAVASRMRLGWLDGPSGLGLGATNTLSPASRRPLDTIKLAIGGTLVFLTGNYINFQPWDRDNAKLFYVFIFVSSALNGALLAAPIEALFGSGPGFARATTWLRGMPPVPPEVLAVLRLARTTTGSKAGKEDEASAVSSSMRSSGAVAQRSAQAGTAVEATAARAGLDASGSKGLHARLAAPSGPALGYARGIFSCGGCIAFVPLVLLSCCSGFMLVLSEYRQSAVLFDADARRVGAWFKENTGPTDLVAHSNSHVQPPASLAGRPSLVAYYGWVSNHGYNANERLGERDYILSNALKEEDGQAVELLLKYGIKYVLSENGNVAEHPRSNPDVSLGGAVIKAHSQGRYTVYRVEL